MGKGEFQWGDGRSFSGEYKNDRKTNYGEYFWPDGRHFKGMWADGL